MKSIHNRIIILYSKYVVCDGLSVILFRTSGRIYLIIKESNYTALFLSINNETLRVPLPRFPSRFMT